MDWSELGWGLGELRVRHQVLVNAPDHEGGLSGFVGVDLSTAYLKLKRGSSRTSSASYLGVSMAPYHAGLLASRTWVYLHELSHVVHQSLWVARAGGVHVDTWTDYAGHDATFCGIYTAVVGKILGHDHQVGLFRALRAGGCQVAHFTDARVAAPAAACEV